MKTGKGKIEFNWDEISYPIESLTDNVTEFLTSKDWTLDMFYTPENKIGVSIDVTYEEFVAIINLLRHLREE